MRLHGCWRQGRYRPRLGPLGANGGPTQSEVPLAGSPAIDKGDNSNCPALDQRGIPRPQGAGCDIGAVELTTPTAATGQPDGITVSGATLHGSANTVGLPAARSTSTARARASGRFLPRPHSRQHPSQPATAALAGLKPSTTYYVALFVTTPDGTATGSIVSFTTAAATPPPPPPPPPSGHTPTSLLLSGLVVSPEAFHLGIALPTSRPQVRRPRARR